VIPDYFCNDDDDPSHNRTIGLGNLWTCWTEKWCGCLVNSVWCM